MKKKKCSITGATLADFKSAGKQFYIWSAKHQGNLDDLLFWGPNSGGYTTLLNEAGIYTAKQAYEVTKGCTNPTGEGLLIIDRKFLRSDLREWGRNHGSSFAIPKHLLGKLHPIRKVAKL